MAKEEEYVWVREGHNRLRRIKKADAIKSKLKIVKIKKHDLRGGQGAYVKKVHMSPEEKRIFFMQTGRHVDDREGCEKVFKETTLRPAEKGEDSWERQDALIEHAESGRPLDKKHTLANIDLFGDYAKRKNQSFDMRERYEYHRARIERANRDKESDE